MLIGILANVSIMSQRLLFVIGSLEVGGAEQHLVQVVCELKKRGWNPELFAFTTGGPLLPRLQEAHIPVFGISPSSWLNRFHCKSLQARLQLMAIFALLAWTMFWRRPALVHFFLPGAYIVGGLASLLSLTKPRVMSRRSRNFYQQHHPSMARLELFLHERMNAICGNSLAVINDLKTEGVAEQKLHLIYNGIDLSRFLRRDRTFMRQKLQISENSLVLICVANLIPYKGHRDLLQALAQIQMHLPQPWTCLCVGRDDGIGAELKAYAAELGIESNVRWLGGRSDIPELLCCGDIGILCSHEEGFSNAVLEGMAAGLPMIVTDVGGNAEAVCDRITGRVVPARQPSLLAKAILEVSADPKRDELGKFGQRRVAENFTLAFCVDQYEALYNEVLRQH